MSNERFPARELARPRAARAVPYTALRAGAFLLLTMIIAAALAVSGCSRRGSDESSKLSKRVVEYGQPVPKGGGRYKVGNPYKIGGRWYTPREDPSYDRKGVASWYGDLFHGRYTANGEIFDMDALTAAHPTLPLPSYVRVTSLHNGRSLVLRVNDRGPYAHDRVIDLSRQSARALGFDRVGTAHVRVQYLGPAPLNGDDSLERRYYAGQPWTQHASLDTPQGKTDSQTVLAGAARTELVADPMVVGAVPTEAKAPPTADWTTKASAAPLPRPEGRPGPHYIQAASFTNRDFADAFREKLAETGEAKVIPAEVGGKTWYRVRVGPYAQRHDADQALRTVIGTGMTDARIVRN